MAQSSKREICATNTSLRPYLNPIFLQILYATRSTEQNYTSSRPTLSSNESLIQTIFEGIYNNKQIIPSPNYKTAGAVFKYPLSFSLAKIPVLTICTHILIFIIKTGNKRYSTIKYLRYPLL